MKRSLIIGILVVISAAALLSANQQGKSLFVKSEKASLKSAPDGSALADVFTNVELQVVEEKGSWVKVQITGWINKASTATERNEAARTAKPAAEPTTDILGGFAYKNVSFKPGPGEYVDVIGEMTNKSGRDYTLANFVVSVYNANDNLLATGYIMISNLLSGQTKSFYSPMIEANYNAIKRYKIDFENGL
jgi:hypothetical protein